LVQAKTEKYKNETKMIKITFFIFLILYLTFVKRAEK